MGDRQVCDQASQATDLLIGLRKLVVDGLPWQRFGLAQAADLAEGGECGFVGRGERVEVLLRRGQLEVPQTFFHDLEVGAACEEPGGVCVPEVVDARLEGQIGDLTRRVPVVDAKPVRRDVRVRVDDPRLSWVVHTLGASLCAVLGVGASAARFIQKPE